MKRPSSAWVVLGVLLLAATVPESAHAAELRRGEDITIGRGEVIQDDLYVYGENVKIEGTVNGDLLVFAQNIELSGQVKGDLAVAGQTVRIGGAVGGTARAAGRSVDATGTVGHDLLAAAETVQVTPDARVARDLWAAGSSVRVEAPVGGELRGAAEQLTVGGEVRGDVLASATRLVLTDNARVGGALKYRSARDAQIGSGAQVSGGVVPTIERRSPGQMAAWIFYGWIRVVVGLTLLGLVLAVVSPRFARAAPLTIRDAPLRTLGWGALVFFVTPLVIALLFGLGSLVGGWWLGGIALCAYVTAVTLSLPIMGLYVGERLLHRFGERSLRGLLLALLLGVAVLTLVGTVPLLGAVVVLAAMMFGLGALLLTGPRLRQEGAVPS